MNKLINIFLIFLLIANSFTSDCNNYYFNGNYPESECQDECDEIATSDVNRFVCDYDKEHNKCIEVSRCIANAPLGGGKVQDCSYLQTSNPNIFTCIYDKNNDECIEISQCIKYNYKTRTAACNTLRTQDDEIYYCDNTNDNYCDEFKKMCNDVRIAENSPNKDYLYEICKNANTRENSRYQCVVGSDGRSCVERYNNQKYIKISKILMLLVFFI